MKRRPAIAIVAGAAIAGVISAAAITSAVASDSEDNGSDTPSASATKEPAAEPEKTPEASSETDDSSAPSDSPAPDGAPAAEPSLSELNVVSADDLRAAGFPVEAGAGTTARGDLQYASSPCLTVSVSSLGGGSTFSGSWTDPVVDEVVTLVEDADAAVDVGETLEGLHRTGGGNDPDDVTVSDPKRVEHDAGFTTWFDVTERLPEGDTLARRVGIVVSDDRVALVTADTTDSSLSGFTGLLETARERLAD